MNEEPQLVNSQLLLSLASRFMTKAIQLRYQFRRFCMPRRTKRI